MSRSQVQANGWIAVPVSTKKILDSLVKFQEVPPYKTQDISFPSEDKLVAEAEAFVKARLSPEAYNHSIRVFYWG